MTGGPLLEMGNRAGRAIPEGSIILARYGNENCVRGGRHFGGPELEKLCERFRNDYEKRKETIRKSLGEKC